tara:strand:+ start:810 stop:998 length:189 start_codon:yes stop_codon:yes gene_type:complete
MENEPECLPGFVRKANPIKLKSDSNCDKNEEFVDVKDWKNDSKKVQERVQDSPAFKFSDEIE